MRRRIGSTSYLGDPARLAALNRHHLLTGSPPNEDYDRLTRLACRCLRTPVSLITIVTEDRQIFVSCVGLPEPWATRRETPLAHSFCQQVIKQRKPVIIANTRDDEALCRHPAVQELGIVAYLGVPLIDDAGNILGVFCVIDFRSHQWANEQIEILHDLSRLAMSQIKLRSAMAQRDDVSARAYDEFLSTASHELRNPVAAIKATAQVLKRTLDRGYVEPERLHRYATELEQSGHRLATLVNDLLDVSRLRAGQISLHPQWIDPTYMCRTLMRQQAVGHHRLLLESVGGPCPVFADPDLLMQVLAKLLDNAVKYSPGGGEVTIKIAHMTGQVLIQIKDPGIGLSAEDQTRIFEPFGRGRNAVRRRLPGMGLGLYVCRQIIAAHGGALWAESPGEGAGTTMLVRLPLADSSVDGGVADA